MRLINGACSGILNVKISNNLNKNNHKILCFLAFNFSYNHNSFYSLDLYISRKLKIIN